MDESRDERSDEPAVYENAGATTVAVSDGDEMVQPVGDDESGWWRCALVIDRDDLPASTEIPFFLWIPSPGDDRPAYVRNGHEHIAVDHTLSPDGDELVVDFPHYDSRIEASRAGDGPFLGTWTKKRRTETTAMRFRAVETDGRYRVRRAPERGNGGGAWFIEYEPEQLRFEMNFDDGGPGARARRPWHGNRRAGVRVP